MTENEFILADRLQKIKSTIEKYGDENFYLSFSGGKDSAVLSALVDMALSENKIPRVYANTGIELNMVRDFVFELQKNDERIVIIKPSVPIKTMLEKDGYPFKSKMHSKIVDIYQRNGKTKTYFNYLGIEKEKYGDTYGERWKCPEILKYQFSENFRLRVSDKCCKRLKEEPLKKWQMDNKKPYPIIGIMRSEGGRRNNANCLAFRGNNFTAFQPLAPLTKEWEQWFIDTYNIKICDIYKPPYNFERTGCKGCPFNIHLQDEIDTLYKLLPVEAKQCEIIWKPIYDEYRRIGYRLRPNEQIEGQMSIYDFIS